MKIEMTYFIVIVHPVGRHLAAEVRDPAEEPLVVPTVVPGWTAVPIVGRMSKTRRASQSPVSQISSRLSCWRWQRRKGWACRRVAASHLSLSFP